MDETVLAEIAPSPSRRAFGIGLLALLGAGFGLAAAVQPGPAGQAVLALSGLGAFGAAEAMRRSTRGRLILSPQALRTSDGTVLVLLDEIVAVESGSFAFRPSNGFLVRTARPRPAAWRPGLWWRAGRRLGVGGVLPGAAARAMADQIAAGLAARSGPARQGVAPGVAHSRAEAQSLAQTTCGAKRGRVNE